MSFGGSRWCRSTPDFEHRSTDYNHHRSTASTEHPSTTPTESTASCNAVRIMTHEEFAARHPHALCDTGASVSILPRVHAQQY
uniref:Uncharacterized protein n=1 Tax=Brassica oleracea var. oleracea TaxID=109376 RepID=A0A0D3E9I8_BRAOL